MAEDLTEQSVRHFAPARFLKPRGLTFAEDAVDGLLFPLGDVFIENVDREGFGMRVSSQNIPLTS